jgi:hypothetical protein
MALFFSGCPKTSQMSEFTVEFISPLDDADSRSLTLDP